MYYTCARVCILEVSYLCIEYGTMGGIIIVCDKILACCVIQSGLDYGMHSML